ncbi:fructofuranosidase/invertase [Flavobacterium sp. CYK-4]|uniref:amylo-alpha-1,6-glucosidase n=1 Tax=Flavobacterium lotistagni TaxID=2709660 RepID=UPI00140C5A04|nr:glycoside hydrolase 100 family protein [Flavobacterium lotistagni]NHM05845.1 fructofuranosidase/invertase [Flavobacterium lotistagni]
MTSSLAYQKSIDLLKTCSSEEGFLASAQPISNYRRVWARDGMICGLAALASGDASLVDTFRRTLETLAQHQHVSGTIPSNVAYSKQGVEVSYGGLVGRVDAVTWYVIGHCQYAYANGNSTWINRYKKSIEQCLDLLQAWEFNNKHLVYVPLSGNWADEYITEGYVLYDQLLRLWALQQYNYFAKSDSIAQKIKTVTAAIEANFFPENNLEKFHPRAYEVYHFEGYAPCCFTPAGYKKPFDAFANALVLILGIAPEKLKAEIVANFEKLISEQPLGLVPAFWPPIFPTDADWLLLENNCKYEFRNQPYEFHNGGSWPMVNGFVGAALYIAGRPDLADQLLGAIHRANGQEGFSFYENFNSQTIKPNGVPQCAWSAAGAILLFQIQNQKFNLLFS